MTMMLNGEARALEAPRSLDGLLVEWGYVKGFAVAVNGEFVPRAHYGETTIREGDSVEVLTPMQGG